MTPSDTSPSPENQNADSQNAPVGGNSPETRVPRPRVFGKLAFWIVAFPFIYYLIGSMIGSNIEQLRVDFLTGKLEHSHEEEGNRPPSQEKEVDISEVEVDPNERFLFGLLPLGKNSYPYTYVFNIAITTALVLLVSWGYRKAPFHVSPLSVVVGVVGFVVWVGLAYIDKEFLGLSEMLSSGRVSFNPFEELKDDPSWLRQFLVARFLGLVVIVPIVEEFFIRGFLIRYVDDPDWDEIPLGEAKTAGWLSPTIYGLVAHMTEPLAAIAWFSMVTWMYKRTKSIWDCVIAHAITNLLLGLYIVKFEQWHLW